MLISQLNLNSYNKSNGSSYISNRAKAEEKIQKKIEKFQFLCNCCIPSCLEDEKYNNWMQENGSIE